MLRKTFTGEKRENKHRSSKESKRNGITGIARHGKANCLGKYT